MAEGTNYEDLKAAVALVAELSMALLADVAFATSLPVKLGNSDETRRIAIRAQFAFIEGVTHAFKKYALAVHRNHHQFLTDGEVVALDGLSYEVNDDGSVVARAKHVRFARNVRLAIRVFGDAQDYKGKVDYSHHGWRSLQIAARIRNRIVHPRLTSDLHISDDDVRTVDEGFKWFQSETLKIISSKQAP
jgi:hypothetical protein